VSDTSVGLPAWLAHGAGSATSALDTFGTWTDAIGTIITAAAVITGGIWAYFKFAKGRTFRPRLEIEMSGQWLTISRKHWLQARIRVTNIGAAKVTLRQDGTGLRVRVLATTQSPAPDYARWQQAGWLTVLEDHAWIEPGETVSDDLLLNLGARPVPVRLDARLIMERKHRGNIEVNARQVLPADAAIKDS
jgi:hypothetical protein